MFQDSYLTVWTPEGLQTLVFFHLVTSFNIRVGREMRAVTLGRTFAAYLLLHTLNLQIFSTKFIILILVTGDLVHVGEPDGTVVYTVYCPGATKKDDGSKHNLAAA